MRPTPQFRKVVIGIDFGTKLGVGILDANDGSLVYSYTYKLKTDGGPRTVSLGRILHVLVGRYHVQGICWEEPFGANKQALKVLYSMMGVAEFCSDTWGYPYAWVNSAKLKKFATGKGNAKKHDMINAANDNWPEFNGDDNQADALHVASWYLQNMANS